QDARRLVDLGTLLLPGGDELADLLELRGRVDGADVGVLVEWVADAQRREAALELRDERLVDRLLDEKARAGTADVSLVEVDPVDDPLDRLVERSVVENDVRGLAAELERELLAGAGEAALDLLPHLGRAGERDLVDVLALDERGAGATVAGDDVDDAGWQLRLAEDVGEEECRERGGLGGLEHHGVAAGQRSRDLPLEHEQRSIPRPAPACSTSCPRASITGS